MAYQEPGEIMVSPDDWETPCPKRVDNVHCSCWYDGYACCSCGDPATEDMREDASKEKDSE